MALRTSRMSSARSLRNLPAISDICAGESGWVTEQAQVSCNSYNWYISVGGCTLESVQRLRHGASELHFIAGMPSVMVVPWD
jgi:hypothetical protein